MILRIQLIDHNGVYAPLAPTTKVWVNDVLLTPIIGAVLAEFKVSLTSGYVKVKVEQSGKRTYNNRFLLPVQDIGNSLTEGVACNPEFTIMLAPELNVVRTKAWKQVKDAYGRLLYWNNVLSVTNPIAYSSETAVFVSQALTPPIFELINRVPNDVHELYGVPTGYNNDLANGLVKDGNGNIVYLINGNPAITGNLSYHYDFVFPHFNYYRNYSTDQLYFINGTSSLQHNVTYQIGDTVVSEGHNNFSTDCRITGLDVTLCQTLSWTQENDCACCNQSVVYKQSEVKLTDIVKYSNDFQIVAQQNKNCTDCNCLITGTPAYVVPQLNYKNPNVRVNDACTPLCDGGTITYKTYNYLGTLLSTVVKAVEYEAIADECDCIADYVTDLTHALTLDTTVAGDLKVIATYEDCTTKCERELVIHVCNWIKLTEDGCNRVKVENCSLTTTLTLTVSTIAGAVVQTLTVPPGGISIISPNGGVDGIYILNYNGINRIMYNDCTLSNCIATAYSKILCTQCAGGDCETLNKQEFHKIKTTYDLYMSYIIRTFGEEYPVLTSEIVTDIFTANDYLKRLNEWCVNVGNCGNTLTLCGQPCNC
jgi:hypothetical protein